MFWESVSIPCVVSPMCHLPDCSGCSGTFSQKALTKAHLTTLNLMEAKEFPLKYKLGHDPSRARVPPADSPGNK